VENAKEKSKINSPLSSYYPSPIYFLVKIVQVVSFYPKMKREELSPYLLYRAIRGLNLTFFTGPFMASILPSSQGHSWPQSYLLHRAIHGLNLTFFTILPSS
jgi:hypothetical protein